MPPRRMKVTWNERECDAEIVDIISESETPNQYLLGDGSSLTLKTVVLQILRVIGEVNQEGDPIYLVKSQQLVHAVPKERLVNESEDDEK